MIEERYQTREEIYDDIRYPENTSNLVIVKANTKGIGYLNGLYSEEQLKDYISEKDFDACVLKLTRTIMRAYKKKRNKDNAGVPILFKIMFAIAFVLSVAF